MIVIKSPNIDQQTSRAQTLPFFDNRSQFNTYDFYNTTDQVTMTPSSTHSSNFSPPPHSVPFQPHQQHSPTTYSDISYQYLLPNIHSNSFNYSSNSSRMYRKNHPQNDEYTGPITYEIFMKQQQQQEQSRKACCCCCCHLNNNSVPSTPNSIEENNNNPGNIIKETTIQNKLNENPTSLSMPMSILSSIEERRISPTQSHKPIHTRRSLINASQTLIPKKKKGSKPSTIKELRVCPYPGCDKAFFKLSHLRHHETSHSGFKPYGCTWPECEWKFARPDELVRHFR